MKRKARRFRPAIHAPRTGDQSRVINSHAAQLAPHLAMIENWLAAEPQLTALAIVSRLSDRYLEQFGKKQRSIVQRVLKSLRNNAAKKLFTPPSAVMS